MRAATALFRRSAIGTTSTARSAGSLLKCRRQPASTTANAAMLPSPGIWLGFPAASRAPLFQPEIYGAGGMMSNREAVMRSLKGFSMEVTPAAEKFRGSFAEILPVGTAVNVTFLPGSDTEETVRTCERLAGDGMHPVPHVAARSLEGPKHLAAYLEGLALRAGVEEVLVVGGGVSAPKGAYHESMQVLESGLLQRFGIKRVGLAAHPEGSPDISDAGLLTALRQKNQWAAEQLARTSENNGFDKVYLATQVCFDDAKLVAWARAIASEADNQLPIRVGLAGPTSLKGMLKFAAMCGVEASARALRQHASTGNLLNIVQTAAPDDLICALARHVLAEAGTPEVPFAERYRPDGAALIEGFHFFSSGRVQKTANWATRAKQGEFTWEDEARQESFAVIS